MNCTNLCFSLFLVLCSSSGVAQATGEAYPVGVMAISYDTGAGVQQADGTSKTESYDAAIRLLDNSLVGKQIVGMRIPIINADGIANLSGWLSTELADGETNQYACAYKSAEAVSGWTEIIFDEPYTVTGDGIYAGYSFDIDKINNQNLKPISTTSEVNRYGYYLRTSRTRKYKNWYNAYDNDEDKGSLRLQVMVAGMAGDAASVDLYPLVNVQSGVQASIPATLYCHGYNGISSIEYEYASGDYKGSGALVLDTPVEAVYNKFASVKLPIEPISELGNRELTLTVTKVNGNDNEDSMDSDVCSVYVFDFVPKHIPLVEEYSGTWCGNCPRGMASMELMKERYGDDFICLTYHNADSMALAAPYPSEIRGFPDCWIDRTKNTDPFFGDRSDGQYHFEEEWSVFNLMPSSVALDVHTEWADDDFASIKATASLRSQIEYFDSEVSLAFVLVADDLFGARWYQVNYYSGDDTCEELASIAAKPSKIIGLHYNDVVILSDNIDGSQYNLPDNIKPLEEYTLEHTFVLSEAVNADGASLVQNKDKLKIVVIALNTKTGQVINCCQSGYMTSSGIEDVVSDYNSAKTVDVKYYDLSGIEVQSPLHGLYIKRVVYDDGRVMTTKTIQN